MTRPGYTLLELLVVMAALVALGGVVVPTLSGVTRDTHVKAAADLVRERVADSRRHAIGDGRTYRLAVSADGHKLHVGPDEQSLDAAGQIGDESGPFEAEDTFPAGVSAHPLLDPDGDPSGPDPDGWVRVATFLSDGTCRDDSGGVEVRQPGCYSLRVTIRGVTGAAAVTPGPVGGTP